jgi:hypothetical protein
MMDKSIVIGMFTAMQALSKSKHYEELDEIIEKTLAATTEEIESDDES